MTLPGVFLVAAFALPSGQDATAHELSGRWEGTLVRLERSYAVMLDIAHASGAYEATIDLPEHVVYGCPLALTVEPKGGRTEAVLVPTLVDGEIRGTFDGDRFSGTSSVVGPDARVELRRRDARPTIARHEEIRFSSGDAELVGTLVTPPRPGPFPIIVWTHGSRPDTRTTFFYHGRAHLLARHGVAGFVYDKRGAGSSTGDGWWKLDVLARDAVAAVDAIRGRPEVDASRIGIAGFSQGGWVAPDAASRSAAVAFVVVGATPGITGGAQNAFSASNALRRNGYPDHEAEAAADFLMRLYRFYATGENRDDAAAALEAARAEAWFDDAAVQRVLFLPGESLPAGRHPFWQPLSPDPADLWRRVNVPVLSMWGEHDEQVPVGHSRSVIATALEAAGNRDATLVILPGASHGFWIVRDDDAPWDWPRQSPDFASTLVEWVVEHTRIERER